LQDQERLILEISRMIKEVLLQQNAYSDDDAFSSLEKTGGLMDALMQFYEEAQGAIGQGVNLVAILNHPSRESIARLRELNSTGFAPKKEKVVLDMKAALQGLIESAA
jgi:vacuolar-type H+-ATPase catalytic subunit A/Vma1